MNSKTSGLIGLCRRSGNLACGASATETAIKTKKCCLVIIAEDAGESIKRKISSLCTLNGIKCIIKFNKEQLGSTAGLDDKAVIAVKSKDFAEGIINSL